MNYSDGVMMCRAYKEDGFSPACFCTAAAAGAALACSPPATLARKGTSEPSVAFVSTLAPSTAAPGSTTSSGTARKACSAIEPMLSSGIRAMAATPAAREAAAAPYSRPGGMPRAPTARGSSAGAAARAVGASGIRSLLRAWVRPMASSSSSTGSSFSTSRSVSPACSSLDSKPRREACELVSIGDDT
eukprot:5169-Heterococcus_DN1.PRE.8